MFVYTCIARGQIKKAHTYISQNFQELLLVHQRFQYMYIVITTVYAISSNQFFMYFSLSLEMH